MQGAGVVQDPSPFHNPFAACFWDDQSLILCKNICEVGWRCPQLVPGDGHPEPHQHAPNMPQTQSLQTHLPLLFSAPSPLDGRAGLKQHLQNPTAPWESTLPPLSNATALHRAPQSLLRVWQSQTPICGGGMLGLHQRCPSLSVSSSITHSTSLSWAHKSPRDPENKQVYTPPSCPQRQEQIWIFKYPCKHVAY